MKILKSLLVFLFITAAVHPQQLGIWKNYSDLKKMTDAYVTEKGVWAVSQGGSFYFNFGDGSYSILNKADGLSNNDLTAVTVDVQGKVWIGSADGSIDIYDPVSREFKRILEIKHTNRIKKNINELYARGDTIYVSTEFGLSLINSNNFTFYESCMKFGNFPIDTKVISSFKDNVTYAVTQLGIAAQRSAIANFSAPESWNTYSVSSSISANTINKVIKYRDTLFAAADRGLFYFNGLNWLSKGSSLTGNYIDAVSKNDSLFLITGDGEIILYSNGTVSVPYPANPYRRFAGSASRSQLFVITDNGILDLRSGNYIYAPNGPRANLFYEMAVDGNSNLYVGSGSGTTFGYYKFDGNQWYNFDTGNNPALKSSSIFRAYVAPDNTLYLCTWGNGFIRVRSNDTTCFTAANTGMIGTSKDPTYVVAHGIRTDTKGNLWVVNYQSMSREPISRLSNDSVWTNFRNPFESKEFLAAGLVIDNNDTKWFTVSPGTEASSPGGTLYYFNPDKPLYNSDVNGWGRVTSEDGLSASTINCLALGRRGELWVGMADGINIIDNPEIPKDPRNISTVLIMRSQVVNTIAVDALNQKWVGTEGKGVFVLSSDGTRLIENYTSENSPLPDNAVKSIAIDNKTGTVYMGTNYGLASISTNSVNPQENLSNMYAYPNPVVLTNNTPVNINISGLVRDSEIKIFTVSGKLIANFSSPGAGIATWNGMDASGNMVSSGIYLIVAYDKEGNNVGTTKVAIIKK